MEETLVPKDPKRVRQFAAFFKNYMSIWSLIVAALPIPLTMLDFIPTFSAHTKSFSLYTSLFCFLLLGFIFYNRHQMGSIIFSEVFQKEKISKSKKRIFIWLPGILIFLCLVSIFCYHITINNSINTLEALPWKYTQSELARDLMISLADQENNRTLPDLNKMKEKEEERLAYWTEILQKDGYKYNTYSEFVFKTTDINKIPNQWLLITFYLMIFLFSEAAFIIMALKEYLQDILGLEDAAIIKSYLKIKDSK